MLSYKLVMKTKVAIFFSLIITGCATNTGVSKKEVSRIEDAHPYTDIYRVIEFGYIGESAPSRLKDAFKLTLGLAGAVASNMVNNQVSSGQIGFGSGIAREVNNGLIQGAGSSFSNILATNKGTYIVKYTSAVGLSFELDRLRNPQNYYSEFIVVDKDPVQALEVGDYIVIELLPDEKRHYKAELKYIRIDKASRLNKGISRRDFNSLLVRQKSINSARETNVELKREATR